MLFRLRFAYRLWRRVSDISLRQALTYPIDRVTFPDASPEEMADAEIDCLRQDIGEPWCHGVPSRSK